LDYIAVVVMPGGLLAFLTALDKAAIAAGLADREALNLDSTP
jgi:hypothetical protein